MPYGVIVNGVMIEFYESLGGTIIRIINRRVQVERIREHVKNNGIKTT